MTIEDLMHNHAVSVEGEPAPGPAGQAEPQPVRVRAPRSPNPKRDSKDHGRKQRRASGIHAYVGANGSGKSAAMVFDTLPTLAGQVWNCDEPTHFHMGANYVHPMTGEIGPVTTGLRRVLSTVLILDAETGLPHPLFDRLCDANGGWRQVLEAEHLDLLLDEVTGIAGSRQSSGMPPAVQNILQQLRKRDVLMRWTAPNWARADSIIRGTTKAVTLCRGYLPDNRLVKHSETPPAWVPNRLFKWRTFAAEDFEEFTLAKAAGDKKRGNKGFALRAKPVGWVWGPGSLMFASYDSYGAVSRVAEYLDGGRCIDCGGVAPTPKCTCVRH